MAEPSVRATAAPVDGADPSAGGQPGPTPRGTARRRAVARLLVAAGSAGAVVALAVTHRTTVGAGAAGLIGADGEWLVAAALGTVAMWVACTVSLLGSMPIRPPVRRVFAVQVAASFANHLLPAGSGGMAVNLRFLQRHGLSRGAAVGAVGLNSLATGVTHLALLVGTVLVAPSALDGVRARLSWPVHGTYAGPAALVLIGVVAVPVLLAVPRGPRRWLGRRAARPASALARLAGEMRELGAVLRHPRRAAALWLGSISLPLLHTLILFSVLRGLGAPIALGTVMVIYLSVSAVAAFVPSPGGIGGLDVALAAGLATAGAPSAVAVGVVLGYRLITVWLPLPPAACTFAVLAHRRII